MRRALVLGTAVALAALTTAPVSAGDADPSTLSLIGRAVLPVETYAPGPQSGAFFTGDTNGVRFPTPSQPVEGFSGIVPGRRAGEYLAMADNGFGTKANSPDFLIRAYYLRPHFTTARGGSGAIGVTGYVEFRDPRRLIGFPIVRNRTAKRLLTGADIDPESLQRGRHGDLWVGDEFGPWILHFDRRGRLVDPPFAVPGLSSPDNPLQAGPATQPRSRGFEGMAISPDGKYLYAAFEGASVADAVADPLRRTIHEFSIRDEAFTGRTWQYHADRANHLIADMWALDRNRLLVLSRDSGAGVTAVFRSVYVVDLRVVDAQGFLMKEPVVDLTAVPDPALVSLPPIHDGDVGLGDPFKVVCQSVEVVYPLGGDRILVGCDNNFPNSGRNPELADDSELVVIRVPP